MKRKRLFRNMEVSNETKKYDYAGRKIADVSPNNYTEIMKTISDSYRIPHYMCKNYNHYWYDTLGRVIKEKTVKSDTTDEEAEIANKIAQGILPEGSTISESEAVGAIVEYTYENEMAGDTIKANKVTKEINLPDNNGVLEISRYDLLGNLIESTTCKGGTPYTTTYQYSNFGKISSIIQPYEVDGNLTTICFAKNILQ